MLLTSQWINMEYEHIPYTLRCFNNWKWVSHGIAKGFTCNSSLAAHILFKKSTPAKKTRYIQNSAFSLAGISQGS